MCIYNDKAIVALATELWVIGSYVIKKLSETYL